MTDMPRIKKFVKDLKTTIPAIFDDNISERKITEILRVASKDKDIYEALIHVINHPECEKAMDEYNNVLNAKIDKLHKK